MAQGSEKVVGEGRRKLIDTARRLFTLRGVAHVGINEVTAEAGVARMTLYNNFPSKEALTEAVYREMAEKALARLDEVIASETTEEKRIASLFSHFGRYAESPSYRGCFFIQASLQEADTKGKLRAIVQTYKKALRQRIFVLLDGKRRNRALLADQITILLDGAVTEAYIKGVDDPLVAARQAALTLARA
jgi:AcrR family transcriptional regulator